MKILMVCTANICRSPMAEGIARALLNAAGRNDITVDSAATHDFCIGDPPDPRACQVMRAHAMPIDDLRARRFTLEDFRDFDQILVADHEHYQYLHALARDDAVRAKIGYMLDTLPEAPGAELPEPVLGKAADFLLTFNLLKSALCARFSHA